MLRKIAALLTLILFVFSCSEEKITESVNPMEEILGKYSTTTFLFTLENDAPLDILSVGGYINIELNEDKSTDGLFYLPDTLGLTEGGEARIELVGLFDMVDNIVTFDQDADTFIRNVEWVYSDSKISGKYSKTDVVIEVVLSKE